MIVLNKEFPYTKKQAFLHISELERIQRLKSSDIFKSKNKEEQETILKDTYHKIERLKAQSPHPAKVLAPYSYCFWDVDVYWWHWEWQKKDIVTRMMGAPLNESFTLLEQFYPKKEIFEIIRDTNEYIGDVAYDFINNRYKNEYFYTFLEGYVPTICRNGQNKNR